MHYEDNDQLSVLNWAMAKEDMAMEDKEYPCFHMDCNVTTMKN